MTEFRDAQALESFVRQTVADVTITDIHTHLFPPAHGNLLLWGVDELLTYHYLVAELFTVAPRELTYEKFWRLSKREQADLVWEHVFLGHGALSEATRGVITTLARLGLDTAGRDLKGIRQWFSEQNEEAYLAKVFEVAGLDYAVMTNNPFNAEEAGYWTEKRPGHALLRAALRIDTLILQWPAAAQAMAAEGIDVMALPTGGDFAKARDYLKRWAQRMQPLYMAASLPPDFHYPSGELPSRVMQEAVLPVARELQLPVAMMIGVRKQVNPALGDGGDAVGVADVTAVMHLCQQNPDVKFLVTMLSRDNQHELTVLARKFGNLHIFGCWWYLNNPSIIEELTRMRLELLGATFTCQHSDARVLDQLIYKWAHTRAIVADVLSDKYRDLHNAGWRPTQQEIQRDVRNLLGGRFEAFLQR